MQDALGTMASRRTPGRGRPLKEGDRIAYRHRGDAEGDRSLPLGIFSYCEKNEKDFY